MTEIYKYLSKCSKQVICYAPSSMTQIIQILISHNDTHSHVTIAGIDIELLLPRDYGLCTSKSNQNSDKVMQITTVKITICINIMNTAICQILSKSTD